MARKSVSLTEYAESKGRASAEQPAPRPPTKPKPAQVPATKPKPVPEEEPKPKVLNADEEKRARMLETLERARAIRRERLAAQGGKTSQASRKGGSVTPPEPNTPAPKAQPVPQTQPAKPEPEPGEVPPITYHPLPDHIEKRVRTAIDEVTNSKITAILVMFRQE